MVDGLKIGKQTGALQGFHVHAFCGEGAMAKVYRAINAKENTTVAIKVFRLPEIKFLTMPTMSPNALKEKSSRCGQLTIQVS